MLYSLAILIVGIFLSNSALAQANKPPELASTTSTSSPYSYPASKAFQDRERRIKSPPAAIDPAEVPFYDYIIFNYINCDANWDQRCEGGEDLNAPDGWQVCKILYDISSAAHEWGFNYTPQNYDTAPAPEPRKFKSYRFTLYSKGSGNPFDRYGGWVHFSNVGLRIIPLTADNNDRIAMGCAMT